MVWASDSQFKESIFESDVPKGTASLQAASLFADLWGRFWSLLLKNQILQDWDNSTVHHQ